MNDKQKLAYEWAKKQEFPSVAARHAKTLAEYIDQLTEKLDRYRQTDITAVKDLCLNCTIQSQLRSYIKHQPGGASADTCVCCGAVIPEGRQVCTNCEVKI